MCGYSSMAEQQVSTLSMGVRISLAAPIVNILSQQEYDQIIADPGLRPDYDSVLGSRYNLSTSHFPFIVKLPENIWSYELCNWLQLQIGENHLHWEWWFNSSDRWRFEFISEEDKVKFVLRWA